MEPLIEKTERTRTRAQKYSQLVQQQLVLSSVLVCSSLGLFHRCFSPSVDCPLSVPWPKLVHFFQNILVVIHILLESNILNNNVQERKLTCNHIILKCNSLKTKTLQYENHPLDICLSQKNLSSSACRVSKLTKDHKFHINMQNTAMTD